MRCNAFVLVYVHIILQYYILYSYVHDSVHVHVHVYVFLIMCQALTCCNRRLSFSLSIVTTLFSRSWFSFFRSWFLFSRCWFLIFSSLCSAFNLLSYSVNHFCFSFECSSISDSMRSSFSSFFV